PSTAAELLVSRLLFGFGGCVDFENVDVKFGFFGRRNPQVWFFSIQLKFMSVFSICGVWRRVI
ncbi:unnamed protein product, partial [Musa acuminata subsp. burmannicoides]